MRVNIMSNDKFDPKDLEEICARKPQKYKMKKADFKELGRNVLLGSIDVAIGGVIASAKVASFFHKSDEYWREDGYAGAGWYSSKTGKLISK